MMSMVALPMICAALVAVLWWLLQWWGRRRRHDHARIYRARFVQLVAQLDTVTRLMTQLELLAKSVRDPKILDYYEGGLRMLENLLQAVRKLPPFATEPQMLDSAFYLVKELRGRAGRTQQAFQDAVRGRPVRYDLLGGNAAGSGDHAMTGPSGCYFCSRPVIADRFARVRVRLDGEVREVISCRICREELESTKKVKVLYFMRDGRPVHWSEVKDYSPSEDFWNINKRQVVRKTTKLELVYSKPAQPLADPQR